MVPTLGDSMVPTPGFISSVTVSWEVLWGSLGCSL